MHYKNGCENIYVVTSFHHFSFHRLLIMSNATFVTTAAPLADSVTPVAPSEVTPISNVRHKTWAHLLEYPTVLEVHKTMESSRWVRPWKVPLMDSFETVSNIQPFKFAYETGDRWTESGLEVLDGYFPSLKTVECQDISNLVTQPARSLHFIAVKGVVEPTAKSINDTRIFVHHAVLDSRATQMAKKVANPVAGTLNLILDSTCRVVLPSVDLEAGGDLSELRKTKVKIGNLVTLKRKPTETAHSASTVAPVGSAAN